MTARKLNNGIRDEIRNDLLEHALGPEVQAIWGLLQKLADDVFNDVLGGLVEKMNSLPDGWLPTSNRVIVQLGGDSEKIVQLQFDGYFNSKLSLRRFKRPELPPRRIPTQFLRNVAKIYETSHQFTIRYQAILDRISELHKRHEQAKIAANSILYSTSTVGALIARWPECEPFARQWLSEKVQLPMVDTEHVNMLLDLPVGGEAA